MKGTTGYSFFGDLLINTLILLSGTISFTFRRLIHQDRLWWHLRKWYFDRDGRLHLILILIVQNCHRVLSSINIILGVYARIIKNRCLYFPMFAKGSDFIFIAFGFSHLSFRHGMSEAQSSTAEDKKKVQINKKMREVKASLAKWKITFCYTIEALLDPWSPVFWPSFVTESWNFGHVLK